MKKKAVLMHLPEGKLPGFYAQIVRELANSALLFDRDKELLILNAEDDVARTIQLLERYKTSYEQMDLLLLPAEAETGSLFADYGFSTRLEHRYLYLHLAAVFRLDALPSGDAEPAQALRQMDEHILVRYPEGGSVRYAVDRELTELMELTAKAYGCRAVFLEET